MKFVFISNYFNHHQKPFCDAMYRILGDGFCFIATSEVSEWRKQLGYLEMTSEYVMKYDNSCDGLIDGSEIVMIGSAPYTLVKKRLNKNRLTFVYSERIYKQGVPWLKLPKHYFTFRSRYGRYNNCFLLCASAFAAYDYSLTHCFLGKCYKWGYFPECKKYDSIDSLITAKSDENRSLNRDISILWAGRFIDWKHPESMIYLAKHLKNIGVNFHIDMIGSGDCGKWLNDQIITENLQESVSLIGSLSPSEVRKRMELADIFCFTSDRNEGWGAVLNESMNSGCAVVGSDAIGSVPYLINNDVNGMIFKNGNWVDLCSKVDYLISHPMQRAAISVCAYKTITEYWNAEQAAENILLLVDALNTNTDTPIKNGPCSVANIIKG